MNPIHSFIHLLVCSFVCLFIEVVRVRHWWLLWAQCLRESARDLPLQLSPRCLLWRRHLITAWFCCCHSWVRHRESWPSAEISPVCAFRKTQERNFPGLLIVWASSLFDPSFQVISIHYICLQGHSSLIASKYFKNNTETLSMCLESWNLLQC